MMICSTHYLYVHLKFWKKNCEHNNKLIKSRNQLLLVMLFVVLLVVHSLPVVRVELFCSNQA